jgi:hypothetical protein
MNLEKRNNLKRQRIISVIIIVVGILLMIMKIYEDSEPGAIPLLLILIGTGLYFIPHVREKQ